MPENARQEQKNIQEPRKGFKWTRKTKQGKKIKVQQEPRKNQKVRKGQAEAKIGQNLPI